MSSLFRRDISVSLGPSTMGQMLWMDATGVVLVVDKSLYCFPGLRRCILALPNPPTYQ